MVDAAGLGQAVSSGRATIPHPRTIGETSAIGRRQLAEHDSGLETVEAIVVGVALVVLDDLAVAEVGVEAALGHGTADVDAVMFVMGGVHGVAGCGQVLRDCSNHESGDGENFRRDSQQVHKRGVSMDGR
ncbi:hypothetical protein D6D10_01777 [Aureobasidium pullulans]|uniref:Uncharacterized protein n=1 Tax=Aureobasidium pullulans TaxID=5580 RepID=A0A4S8ZY80_AURPU|nr:hypothetical protein D6D25_00039 [Aureobasidium pullulans]THX42630.1 hypothetical protein D6D10_01777 [Aureobasidium pullulans]